MPVETIALTTGLFKTNAWRRWSLFSTQVPHSDLSVWVKLILLQLLRPQRHRQVSCNPWELLRADVVSQKWCLCFWKSRDATSDDGFLVRGSEKDRLTLNSDMTDAIYCYIHTQMLLNEENLTNAPFKCTNLPSVISLLCETWLRLDGALNRGCWGAFSCWGNHHISASYWLHLFLLNGRSLKTPQLWGKFTLTDQGLILCVKASCLSATLTPTFIIFSEGCYRDERSCSLRKLLQVLGRYCIMPTSVTSLGYLKSPLATTHRNTGLQTL